MQGWHADDGTPLTFYAMEASEGDSLLRLLWVDEFGRLYMSWWDLAAPPGTQIEALVPTR